MNSTISKFLFVFIAAGLLGLAGCNNGSTGPYGTGSSTTTAKSSPSTVVINSYAFNPSTLTVSKGTVVTWQNNDPVAHTATSDSSSWDSGNIPASTSKTTTFNTPGTFPYHCTYHPMMMGTIIVQ